MTTKFPFAINFFVDKSFAGKDIADDENNLREIFLELCGIVAENFQTADLSNEKNTDDEVSFRHFFFPF
jgi:hypothetical protein